MVLKPCIEHHTRQINSPKKKTIELKNYKGVIKKINQANTRIRYIIKFRGKELVLDTQDYIKLILY